MMHPENYFHDEAKNILLAYKKSIQKSLKEQQPLDIFPEKDLLQYVDNTWRDTAKAVFNNWLGKVYQITNQDRRLPFMAGIDPKNPLKTIPDN